MTEESMRVMWCERPNELEVRRVPVHSVGDHDVLIKVAYAGICPWDVRAYSGLSSSVAFPRILGHELSGTVAAVGKDVHRFEVGQRVVPDMIVKCGVCQACRSGRPNRCRYPTYMQFGGGFSDYVVVPEKNIYPLHAGTSMRAAAFMEPLACVVRGQNGLSLYPGEVELVAGLGPIGLMHMQVARAFGARVIASDPVPERLVKAKELGAEWTINPTETDLGAFVKDVTDGWGIDAAAITVGSARLVEQVVPMLAPGGRLNIFAGIYPKDQVHLDPNLIHYGEYVITGSADSTPENMYKALGMIESGQVKTETLISHLLPLEELGKGFDIVKNRQGLKIMMNVNGDPA
ncbi:MAG: alcohol dehydrogenase catalytic domain-containing protein [Chloroflexi bacterium]|nr:alcohol dehydrogenase catalytic domain-containing protein [Anaerolineaceae bacterium]NMB90484.1 alcohol dehydrogenase catalytic domain-containing protein [Chloroflexota bacterium]